MRPRRREDPAERRGRRLPGPDPLALGDEVGATRGHPGSAAAAEEDAASRRRRRRRRREREETGEGRAGADHAPVFFIPAPPHGYFTTAAGPGATSFPAVYAVAQHNGNANASGNGPSPAAASNAQAYAPQVAYDSNGRAIYYTSVLPQYASAVSGVPAAATVLGTDPAKPVAVKPTVS